MKKLQEKDKIKKMKKQAGGITLIALVITIIVLLILAGVSIAMLTGQNGILTQAQNASKQTDIGEEKEQTALAYNGAKTENDGGVVTYEDLNRHFEFNKVDATASGESPIKVKFNDSQREYEINSSGAITEVGVGSGQDDENKVAIGEITGNEIDNTKTQDKYGNELVVPAGFKVVNPDDDVTKGIIIEDVSANGEDLATVGSQFVWVPVGEIITDENGTKTTITLGRYDFANSRRNTCTNI